MKHQYEDYIEWVDERKKKLLEVIEREERFVIPAKRNYDAYGMHESMLKEARIALAQNSANRAGLERHKPDGDKCAVCYRWEQESPEYPDSGEFERIYFACPSLLDVTNPLDEVMG